ncbi:MAG: HutD family protein, partial [Paracoccaceae bacterium]|nr:HutD family protein [Paracoccaceae bacterium]
MKHLTTSDYRKMPWANGLGVTTEILRVTKPDGSVLWRLSMAAVVEDGAFSLFPGIERNLTVIAGPGFDLVGSGLNLRADPLMPVAFPGDVAIAAAGVSAPSDDFNVMT